MKKRILIIGGIVVLVLLLAGAAYVGAGLLSGQGPLANASLLLGGNPNKHATAINDILPAKELPPRPADTRGLFDHRQDNSFFVGTGQISLSVEGDRNGHVAMSSSHDGPIVEVVISHQTTIYRDVTEKQFNGPSPSGKVQQVIEPGSLDEVGQYSLITAWGNQSGNRLIADVLVYTPPPVFNQ